MPTPDPHAVSWPARTPAHPRRTPRQDPAPAIRRPGRVNRPRPLAGLSGLLSADWTVSVHDGPVTICTYPPQPLPAAWSLVRAIRRCWPEWQARLTPPPRGRHG
jgi:hypothetical protein